MTSYDDIKDRYNLNHERNSLSSDPYRAAKRMGDNLSKIYNQEDQQAYLSYMENEIEKGGSREAANINRKLRDRKEGITNLEDKARHQRSDSRFKSSRDPDEVKTGFISRPRVADWEALLSSGGAHSVGMPQHVKEAQDRGEEVTKPVARGAMFQFQEKEIVEAFMMRVGDVDMVTQRWKRDDPDSVSAQIFAPNAAAQTTAAQVNTTDSDGNKTVITVGKPTGSSFHPKVGYVKGWNEEEVYAYLGTQNITSALDRNSTMESMMVLDAKAAERHMKARNPNYALNKDVDLATKLFGSDKAAYYNLISHRIEPENSRDEMRIEQERSLLARKYVEQVVGQEVITVTDDLLNAARKDPEGHFSNLALAQLREKRKSTDATSSGLLQNFVLYNHEILEEYNSVLDIAVANSNSGAVGVVHMSINRMEGLLRQTKQSDPSKFKQMKENMVKLARQGKLQVVTDRNNYSKELQNSDIDEGFLSALSDAGALKFDPVMHHDKGILITDSTGKAVYSGIQSANPSKVSMSEATSQLKSGEMVSGDDASTEVMMRIRGGVFLDEMVSENQRASDSYLKEKQAYEDFLENKVGKEHYTSLGGRSEVLQGNDKLRSDDQGYSTMHYSEQRADSTGVEEFMKQVEKINQQYGRNVIDVTPRYAPGEAYRKGGKTFKRAYNEVVGIRVRINSTYKGQLNARGLEVDLTVNRENNVILSDLNKLLGSSLVLNRTEQEVPIPGTDKTIKPLQSMQLNSQETALSALTTMVSEVSYKHRYGLSGAVYQDMTTRDSLAADKGIGDVINQFILKELVRENPNDTDIRALVKHNAELSNTITLLGAKGKGQQLHKAMESFITYASTHDINTGDAIYDNSVQRQKRTQLENMMEGLRGQVQFAEQSDLSLKRLYVEVTSNLLGTELHSGSTDVQYSSLGAINSILLSDYANTEISVLEDFRSLVVAGNDEYHSEYSRLEKTQSREIMTLVTDPYLAPHDQQRSGMQRALPVYAVEESRMGRDGDELYDKAVRLGILDPAAVKHADSLGKPGEFQRPLASVSQKDQVQYGKAGSANVLGDREASTIKVIEMLSILQGVSGFGYSELKTEVEELAGLYKDVLGREPNENELENIIKQLYENKRAQYTASFKDMPGEETPLFLIPYTKIEQITQRMKNVVGSRPAKEVSKEVYNHLLSLNNEDGITPDHLNNLWIGQLRASLPPRQWEVLKEREKEYKEVRGMGPNDPITNTEEFFSYLIEMENDPLHENVGLMGPQQLKRVALHGGFNTLGDYGIINEGFEQPYAETKTSKLTFNLGDLQSVTGITQRLSKYMSKGSKVIGSGPNAGFYVYEDKLSWDEDQHIYVTKQGWVKAGTFTDTGQIQFNREAMEKLAPNRLSLRAQPVTMSVGAYGKSFEEGVSVFTGDLLTIDTSARGTLIATQEQTTINMPGSGSRRVGGGSLPKGPQYVVQQAIFDTIEERLNERTQKFRPSTNSVTKEVVQLATLSQFKGFTYETGMTLLSDKQSRDYLTRSARGSREQQLEQGRDIAQSLAFLLVGDDEVRKTLSQHYRSKEQYTISNVISGLKGSDVSSDKLTSLNILAQGLAALNRNTEEVREDMVEGELRNLKNLVKEALSQDTSVRERAQEELAKTSAQLFDLVTTDEKYSKTYGDRVSLVEHSSTVKSAGILAHILYFNQQLFNDPKGPQGMKSVGGLFQQQLPPGSTYLNIRDAIRRGEKVTDDERRRYDFANYIATSTGLRVLDEDSDADIRRKINLLRDAQSNDILIEFFIDSNASKSLVSAGQKDQVAFEYHYYLGLRRGELDKFREKESLYSELASIQDAYSTLTAALGGVYKTSMDQLKVRTIFNSDLDPEMFDDKQKDYLEAQTQQFQKELTNKIQKINRKTTLTDSQKRTQIEQAESEYKKKIYDLQVKLSQQKTQFSRQELDLRLGAQAYASYQGSSYEDFLQNVLIKGGDYSAYGRPQEVENSLQELKDNMEYARKETGHLSDQHKDYMHGVLTAFQHFHAGRNRLTSEIDSLERQLKERNLTPTEEVAIRKKLRQAKLEKNETLRHIRSLGKTQQVIIPHMDVHALSEEGKEGMYVARIRDYQDSGAKPSVGVILGADLLQQLSLVFGSHKDEAIIAQINLLEAMELAQPVLNKIQDPTNNELTEAEASALINLQDAARKSSQTLTAQVTNETMKKAYGEHEGFSGAVGYALNSFGLSPHEMVLGDRFARITSDYQLDVMINNELEGLGRMMDDPGTISSLSEERFLSSIERLETLTAPLAPHLASERENDEGNTRVMNFIKELTEEAHSESLKYQAFEKYVNKANIDNEEDRQRRRTKGQEKAVKAYYYQRMLGLKKESEEGYDKELLNFMNTILSDDGKDQEIVDKWDKQLNMMLGGQVRRSGSPTSDYALMGEFSPDMRILTTDQFENRLRSEGSNLLPSKTRSNPLLMVPSLSSLIAGLGDYDGDSYQVLLSKAQKAQEEVLAKHKEYKDSQNARIAAKVKWQRLVNVEDPNRQEIRSESLALTQTVQKAYINELARVVHQNQAEGYSNNERSRDKAKIESLKKQGQAITAEINQILASKEGAEGLQSKEKFESLRAKQDANRATLKDLTNELLDKGLGDDNLREYLMALSADDNQENANERVRILNLQDEIAQYSKILELSSLEEKSALGKIASKAYQRGRAHSQRKEMRERRKKDYKDALEIEQQVEEELNQAARDFDEKGIKLREGYEKHMNALGRFVKNFTSLPEFAFDGLSTPEQLTYISQKFDDSGVQDADWLKQAERKIDLFGKVLGYQEDQEQKELDKVIQDFQKLDTAEKRLDKAEEYINQIDYEQRKQLLKLYSEDEGEGMGMAAGELVELMQQTYEGRVDKEQILTSFYSKAGNYQQTVQDLTKSFKKVEGVVLNPFEYEAIQGAVGEGGSKLIGAAYNTLIPLMERSMFEQGILTAMNASSEKDKMLKVLAGSGEGGQQELVEKLGSQELQDQAQQRYFSTLSTLTSFQQLVRDALKAKSGSALNDAFKNTGYIDAVKQVEDLKQKLSNSEGEESKEEIRKQIALQEQEVENQLYASLTNVTGTVVSPGQTNEAQTFISKFSGKDKSSLFSSDQVYDTNLTAFGVLMELSKFTKLNDARDIYSEFIDKQGNSVDTGGEGAERYVAGQIAEAIQRTEAAYKATTLTGQGQEVFIQQSMKWYAENKDRAAEDLTAKEKNYQDLIAAYQEASKETAFEIDQANMDTLLVQELILANIKEDNETTGAMNADTVMMLREMQQAQQDISSDEYGIDSTKKSFANVMARQMARGKIMDIGDATAYSAWHLQAIDYVLEQMGYTKEEINQLSPKERAKVQAKLAKISPTGAFQGLAGMTQDQQNALVGLISGLYDTEEYSASDALKFSTEGMSKILQYSEHLSGEEIDDSEAAYAYEQISNLQTSEGKTNIQLMREIADDANDYVITAEDNIVDQASEDRIRKMQAYVEKEGKERQERIDIRGEPKGGAQQGYVDKLTPIYDKESQKVREKFVREYMQNASGSGPGSPRGPNSPRGPGAPRGPEDGDGLIFRNSALEGDLFGAFGSLALFSLIAANETPEDDRMALMALDSARALGEITAGQSKGKRTWTGSLMGGDMTTELDFKSKMTSLRQSMEAQGATRGFVQGMGQQLVSKGFNDLAGMAVQRMMPVRSRVRGTTAIAGMGAEVLGSLMSTSVSRVLTRHKTNAGTDAQDFVSGYLINFIESVWQMVEEMQLALINSNTEVLDSSHNNNWDFDTDGYLSEFEWDVESGMIVLDAEDTPLESVFDSDSASNQQLQHSVDQTTG